MQRSLVIVESPAKAKTINKYLGNQFVVKSSIGHIRDLPKGGQKINKEKTKSTVNKSLSLEEKARLKQQQEHIRLFERMGIDPANNWSANYEILDGKQKVIAELKKLAKDDCTIYLATDLDREGEAIAWHLQEVIGGPPERFKRVIFNEITKTAISKAFEKPTAIDYNRVYAQQTRRFLDRIVGFMLSPLLWKKVARGLSAGRVQSVAVKILVKREQEIKMFVPEEYWTLKAHLTQENDASATPVQFEVSTDTNDSYRPTNKAQSDAAVARLEKAVYVVTDLESKPITTAPPTPFITSTLQQAASLQSGFGVKRTMALAQQLYEAGYITYMRTDSTNLSADAVAMCRDYISKNYGEQYLPQQPQIYNSKAGAQDAHEAIRPTDINIQSESLVNINQDAIKLYQLIWQRFTACQMSPAKFETNTVTVSADEFKLKIKGRVMLFDGFHKVLPFSRRKEDTQILPSYTVGEQLKLEQLLPEQHYTKAPARYTEASLVKTLEKSGVGRPSTYANIISTIQDRGYIRLENKKFFAEKIGEIVTERLDHNFKDLMDYQFTARMEQQLDSIAEGNQHWQDVLNQFYSSFTRDLELANVNMMQNAPIQIDINCAQCSRPLQIRNASTGVFLGCSGYALPPNERCKNTIGLTHGEETISINDEEDESKLILTRQRCSACNAVMEPWLVNSNQKIHICSNNPDCKGYQLESGEFKIKGYDGPELECDKCSRLMHLKTGRFGKYFDCTNADCPNTRKLLRNGQPAPPKIQPIPMPELKCEKVDDFYLLRDGAAGLFLAASKFPKFRETRAPKLAELRPHANELDSKYQYLLSGPDKDPDGNEVFIRFSKKNSEVYLRSEAEGKPTGWSAFYKNQQWLQGTR